MLQVHDELLLEVPEAEVSAVRELVRDEMGGAYPLDPPLARRRRRRRGLERGEGLSRTVRRANERRSAGDRTKGRYTDPLL